MRFPFVLCLIHNLFDLCTCMIFTVANFIVWAALRLNYLIRYKICNPLAWFPLGLENGRPIFQEGKSGNFDQTGKIRFYLKYWENQEIIDT